MAGADNRLNPPQAVTSAVRRELPGGARVLVEPDAGLRSAAMGVWVSVGGRDEPTELAGASHFLEHLLFKGTARHSARQIAEAIDGVGGDFNAYTSKEHTGFYVRVPAVHAAMALDVLLDVVTGPRLDEADVHIEREVIREELLQRDDTPDDLVHDLVLDALFPGHPLGRDILGDHSTIDELSRNRIADFFERHYGPSTFVVAAAGALDADAVTAEVEARLPSSGGAPVPRTRPGAEQLPARVVRRAGEQEHVVLGWRSLPDTHPDRFAMAVISHVLGGGTASRLFEEVREQRGLAYSVYAYSSAWTDAGLFATYAGTAPGRAAEATKVMRAEVERVAAEGITERELELATGFVEGALAMSLEQTSSRMSRLAGSELVHGRIIDVEEQLAAYRAVSLADVRRVAGEVVSGPPVVAAVGPAPEEEVRSWAE